MHKLKNVLKGIAKNIAVSFFFTAFLVFLFFLFVDRQVRPYFTLISNLSYSEVKTENQSISFDTVEKRLTDYPNYGTVWATIKIPALNLELPVYHGDTLDILRYGVGHLAGSYFPGEGGGIVLDAHNNEAYFGTLPNLAFGDEIVLDTIYGTYTYEMTEAKIIKNTEEEALPVKTEEELLMLYTCYPPGYVGLTNERYVVYAKLKGADYNNENN